MLDTLFFRSRRTTGGDDEAARSPPGQGECTPGEPTEPRLDDEAEPVRLSKDVSTSSEQLLQAAMVNMELEDLIQND